MDIFTKKEFDKMLKLKIDTKEKMKLKDSNIQIVSNILKLYYENKINVENIDLESEILLNEEECQAILDKFFDENKFGDNYYQKNMLINFLAVQFQMFTECVSLTLDLSKGTLTEINRNNTIIKVRPKIVESIINSAILATSGPFDKLIKIENESFKENANFNEINNDNRDKDIDTINYDSIKGCLFFFNEDKEFFTIITNNPTSEDYDLFLSLFNTQEINDIDDFDLVEKHHLIDYGNLTHEEYIQQLRKIFNIPDEINIKEIAKKNDNYTFTRDNFLKMALIYFRIKSNIPVILMGETGCGKTSLIKMLSLIINKGKEKMKIMNIHGGITDNDIINFIKNCEKEIEEEKKKEIENEINKFKESKEKKYYKEEIIEENIKQKIEKEKVWIFFDEINTCNSLGLINEIMIEKTMNGEKINDNFVFIGSCNPYRIVTKKMKESGLVYHQDDIDNKILSELVYNVNPLPISLINYIFNFGSLTQKDEKIYISSIIQIYFDKLTKKGEKTNLRNDKKEIKLYGLINIDLQEIEKEKINIINSIFFCHNYLKERFDNSLISLRDIKRFIIFYDWFLKYLINESTQQNLYQNYGNKLLKDCLNLTLYICYYLRLSDMDLRKDFRIKMAFLLEIDSFLELPLKEEKYITNQFIQDNENDIVLNRVLRENLLTLFICVNVRQPLIIVGKPGTGKTLSINCISNSMKGEFSENSYFKRKYRLVIYRYQGSERTKSEDILNIFKKVRNSMENKNNDDLKNISMFLFDEMGLAQKGENNPLKVLNSELEYNSEKNNKISFVGISNWKLDSSKMNRVLYLLVNEPNNDELIETSINIAEFLDKNLSSRYDYWLCSLAKTYYKYKTLNLDENKAIKTYLSYYFNDFHGNRDFYYFIKDCMNDLIEQKNNIDDNNSNLFLTKIGLKNIEKNFGGIPNVIEKIKSIFLEEFSQFNSYNPINYIKENLNKKNRYLMLINNSSINEFILSCTLKNLNYKNYILIKGSPFISDIENTEKGDTYKRKILKKIQNLTSEKNILIMKNLDNIYPFLFNLFNQSFIKKRNKDSYIDPNSFFEININLKIIVLANNNNLKRHNLPFINRFEKHIISMNDLLNKESIELAQEIFNQLLLITSFNNNKNNKIDLFNMLIIKDIQEIAGMIYKIISKMNLNDKSVLAKKDYIIEEIYKILVPTFSQDLIVSVKYSNFERKNKKLAKYIYKIYKEKSRYNFNDFLSKIDNNNMKYIIYTFSNISDLINITEKNSNFYIIEEIVDNIKSENEFENILKNYYNNPDQNLLIIHFRESDFDKLEYISYRIKEYEKNMEKFKLKKIIFIFHIKRKLLKKEKEEEVSSHNIFNKAIHNHNNLLINIEDENNNYYEHLFIDNLNSENNFFSDFILSNNCNYESLKKVLDLDNFFNKYIYQIFSYFSYTFYNETKQINKTNYIKKVIVELTHQRNDKNNNINDILIEYLKDKIKNLVIKESSYNINNIIPKIYISNIFEKNDVDFFDVLLTYIYSLLKKFLLLIIYILENNNYLCPIIFNKNNNIDIELYKSIINQYFNSLNIYIYTKPKEEYNSNLIKLNLGLAIPGSVLWFKEINTFLIKEKIIKRYQDNDNLIRKNNFKKENIFNLYIKEYNQLIKNTEEEIKKNLYINNIISCSNNIFIKIELIYDYIKIYISEISYKLGNNNKYFDYFSIIKFITIILSFKFNLEKENDFIKNISLKDSQKYITIFSKIILFLESYTLEILPLSEIYIEISNFIPKMEEKIKNTMKEIINNNGKSNYKINEIFNSLIETFINIILTETDIIFNLNLTEFFQFFERLKYINTILNKIDKKLLLFNDSLFFLEIILLIYDISSKNNKNMNSFKTFIINTIKNVKNEINYIKNKDINGLSNNFISLQKLIENKFGNNSNEYSFIISRLLRIHYKKINDSSFKYLMICFSFENDKLISNSLHFLNEIINVKFNKNSNDFFFYFNEEKENRNLLFLENINSEILNQVILYYLELKFNKYFISNISNKETNLKYIEQSINYLDDYSGGEQRDVDFPNLKKLSCISFIKVFLDYYSKIYFQNKNNDKKSDILIDYKTVENIINKKDSPIRNIIIIYFYKCFYHNHFDIIIKFNKYINEDNHFPFRKKYLQYQKEITKEQFIFENCFISPNDIDVYLQEKNKLKEIKEKSFKNINILNFEYYKKNGIDAFYCLFINHIFSPIFYSDKKEQSIIILNEFIKEFETNIINKVLIINKEYIEIFKSIYTQKIFDKIEKEKEEISQNIIEILLYGLRFVLSSKSNNNNYYSLLLSSNCEKIIKDTYVPGAIPYNNVYLNSYYALKELMPITNENEFGFYVCSCGQYYTLGKCTCPAYQFNCQNCGLIIGGIGHYLEEREDHFRLYLNKDKFNENEYAKSEVISNKIPYMFFDEYKKKYIDKYLNEEPKGINIKKEDLSYFIERKQNVRNMSELSFRILNFILYSHLFCANIIGNLSNEGLDSYLYENYSCIKNILKDWELIDDILKEKNINNIKEFINIIFYDICEILKECTILDSMEKRKIFEDKINKYILDLISNKEILEEKINKYKKANEKIKNSDPSSIEEIILESFPPIKEFYPESIYPELKYFMKSIYPDNNLLYKELISKKDYAKKYALLNQVIISNEEFKLIQNVTNINKLCNILLNKYSYKISRDDAKKLSLFSSEEIGDKELFKKTYFEPYLSSWNKIKKYCTRYLCQPDMPELTIDENTKLNYFLVDDGELGGGMYLSSAYSNFIEWQNKFISFILDNLTQDSILNCYSSQLNQEIYVQDAIDEDVLKFNDDIQKELNNMMIIYSFRNIFNENNNKINYNNYRRIKFNFEGIEEELGKLILPGLKKFKTNQDPIRFVVYLYEGYRSAKSSILSNYEAKYPSRELCLEEKNLLFIFMKENEKDRKIMKEILSSCQILIDYIQKENYNKNQILSDIIENLPYYLELNRKFKNFFKNSQNKSKSFFTINTLLNIYKIIELFCWKETEENINEQYKESIDKDKRLKIIQFFKDYNLLNDKLIGKNNLAAAIRRFISRYLAGKRVDTDIDEKQELILQITRNDLWDLNIIQNVNKFQSEIATLTFDLKISQAYEFYKILGEDTINSIDLKDKVSAEESNKKKINYENEIKEIKNNNKNIDTVINYFYSNK